MSYIVVKGEPLEEPSDEALMSLNDEAAFERLVGRYEHRLFNYARRILGNASDAEDVFQETFLRVYAHRKRFRRGAPFRPWVYRIATNLCKDVLRKRKRRRVVSLDTPSTRDDDSAGLGERMASSAPDPAVAAQGAETAARLARAVEALPLKQRTVFVMARYDNLPYAEIAKALKIPLGTVKSRMNTAVNTLMNALREEME